MIYDVHYHIDGERNWELKSRDYYRALFSVQVPRHLTIDRILRNTIKRTFK